MPQLYGMDIITHPDTVERKRTWRERLLSWPWRPWVRSKWVENPIFAGRPSDEVLVFGRKVVMRESQLRASKLLDRFHSGKGFPLGGYVRGPGDFAKMGEKPSAAMPRETIPPLPMEPYVRQQRHAEAEVRRAFVCTQTQARAKAESPLTRQQTQEMLERLFYAAAHETVETAMRRAERFLVGEGES